MENVEIIDSVSAKYGTGCLCQKFLVKFNFGSV
jgi:hypothetical protein